MGCSFMIRIVPSCRSPVPRKLSSGADKQPEFSLVCEVALAQHTRNQMTPRSITALLSEIPQQRRYGVCVGMAIGRNAGPPPCREPHAAPTRRETRNAVSGRAIRSQERVRTQVGVPQCHRRRFRAPARCRPEAGVPSRPRAAPPSAMRGVSPSAAVPLLGRQGCVGPGGRSVRRSRSRRRRGTNRCRFRFQSPVRRSRPCRRPRSGPRRPPLADPLRGGLEQLSSERIAQTPRIV